MRKLVQIITLSLLVACFTEANAQGLGSGYKGVVLLNNTQLAEDGSQLNVTFEVVVRGAATQKYAAIYLVPRVVAEDGKEVALPEIVVQGKGESRTFRRWERTMSKRERSAYERPQWLIVAKDDVDEAMSYSVTVPYELWMDNAVLTVDVDFVSYRDEHHRLTMALGGRVELESKVPYEVHPYVNLIEPLAEQKTRRKQGQAFLDFQAGRSEIVPTYRRNPEELAKIRAAFNEVITNPDVTVNGLFIEGYASPEGSYATNKRLSLERSNALIGYIVRHFSLPITTEQISTGAVAEDWVEVRAAIQASDISRKEQMLSIIDNTADPDQREAKLRQMGPQWQILMRDVFPDLRRVEYLIDFSVRDYTTQEAEAMIGKGNMLLSQRELYQVAMGYDYNSAEFANIMLDIIPQLYPNDITAIINAAAVMIQRGETATAKRFLEKLSDQPQAWNNLGVLYMLDGNFDSAEQFFEKAAANGVKEAQSNLDELNKKREDNIRVERYRNR